MEPVINHIQITVRDFPAAFAFYDRLFFKDLEGIKYEIVTHSHAQGMQA